MTRARRLVAVTILNLMAALCLQVAVRADHSECGMGCDNGLYIICGCTGWYCDCACWGADNSGCSCWCASGCGGGADCAPLD